MLRQITPNEQPNGAFIALRNGKPKEEFPLTGSIFEGTERYFEEILCEANTKQGRTLSPSALTRIRAGVHRFITTPPNNRTINILKDSEFIPAYNMFQAKCK